MIRENPTQFFIFSVMTDKSRWTDACTNKRTHIHRSYVVSTVCVPNRKWTRQKPIYIGILTNKVSNKETNTINTVLKRILSNGEAAMLEGVVSRYSIFMTMA